MAQIANFGMLGCRQFFLVLKGAVNLKRLKNTAIEWRLMSVAMEARKVH
jgi:hypothetical protein